MITFVSHDIVLTNNYYMYILWHGIFITGRTLHNTITLEYQFINYFVCTIFGRPCLPLIRFIILFALILNDPIQITVYVEIYQNLSINLLYIIFCAVTICIVILYLRQFLVENSLGFQYIIYVYIICVFVFNCSVPYVFEGVLRFFPSMFFSWIVIRDL